MDQWQRAVTEFADKAYEVRRSELAADLKSKETALTHVFRLRGIGHGSPILLERAGLTAEYARALVLARVSALLEGCSRAEVRLDAEVRRWILREVGDLLQTIVAARAGSVADELRLYSVRTNWPVSESDNALFRRELDKKTHHVLTEAELTVLRHMSPTPRERDQGPFTITVSGPNARVNLNISDHSTNSYNQTPDLLFQRIRDGRMGTA